MGWQQPELALTQQLKSVAIPTKDDLMIDDMQVAEALERFHALTAAELAVILGATEADTLKALERASARPTGRKFAGSPVYEHVPEKRKVGKPRKMFTEDEVLDMWELYEDKSYSLDQVAALFDVSANIISRELRDLGVELRHGGHGGTRTKSDVDTGLVKIDPLDPFKGLDDEQRISFEHIMAALARIGDGKLPGDSENRRHLPYARSLPHVKPTRRRIPMSKHQRYMDRLGSGIWATVVRADLRRAGMMPR